MLKSALLIFTIIILSSCKPLYNNEYKKPVFSDKKVSMNTKKLHKKLFYLTKTGIAIGHQDDTSYGIGWTYNDNSSEIKSDINDIINKFPAVYGFDIGHLELGNEKNLDGVSFSTMRSLIIDAYKKGGIITISWHPNNPTSNGDSWDKTPAVKNILEQGNQREIFELWISRVATFFNSLEYKGKSIPIIFRPWHEMNGSWFWWGEGNCSNTDYITLWQDTVKLLRDKHKVHNVLYAYSPNKLNSTSEYLKYYPGDTYVDLLGIDIYDFNNSDNYIDSVKHDLKLLQNIATQKRKLYAFTETGLEAIPTDNWFTTILYPAIKNSGITYVLFWRNHTKKHHYVPYKGHINESDFIHFEALPETLFLEDINTVKH